MKIWYNNILDSRRYVVDVVGTRVRIGRGRGNDIILDNPYVAEEAIVLHKRSAGWELVVLGLNGCQVGDREVLGGDRALISSDEVIKLFPFTLSLDIPDQQTASSDAARRVLDEEMSQMMLQVHLDLLSRMDLGAGDSRGDNDDYILTLERNLEEIAKLRGLVSSRQRNLVTHIAGHAVRSDLLRGMLEASSQGSAGVWETHGHWSRMISSVPDREDELRKTCQHFARQLKLDGLGGLSERIEAVERQFWGVWSAASGELFDEFKIYLALRYFKKQVKDVIFGYGPLEDLLRIPTISEIMVVDRDHIYIEKNGVLENSGRRFISDEVTHSIIERIVTRVGRRIDKAQPLVDARLTDGSRVNAISPPLAVSGPALTIRKFPQRSLLIDDLVQKGSLTRTVAEFLRASVVRRKNVIISGGTGTGKTTLLNCISDFIPDKERIVTIEDTAELQLKKEHVVRLETKQANIEGAGAYTIRDLVKNSLRMRPDRIVVGECRGGEALDMLQAMNTGHDGSMTTIHANSAPDVILRLEVLVQMAADLPIDSIHRQIASAVDLIVQLTRLRDGRRVVSQVAEVVGIDDRTHEIITRDLFRFEEQADHAGLVPTGRLPTFMPELVESGLIQVDSFYL